MNNSVQDIVSTCLRVGSAAELFEHPYVLMIFSYAVLQYDNCTMDMESGDVNVQIHGTNILKVSESTLQ